MLAFWGLYVTGSLAVKRELFIKVPNRPACTPKHKTELQIHQHFDTQLTLLAACTKLQTIFLYWIGTAKIMVPKKAQKCGNRGRRVWISLCWDKRRGVPFANIELGLSIMTQHRAKHDQSFQNALELHLGPQDQQSPNRPQTTVGGGWCEDRCALSQTWVHTSVHIS